MKNIVPIYRILILMVFASMAACETTLNQDSDETDSATFIQAFPTNGVIEGQIDQTIQVTVEFTHPSPNLAVKEVIKQVIDDFKTEYTIIAEFSSRDETFDSITVDYDINETGSHQLLFFYKLGEQERQSLGRYDFAINN